MLSIITKTSQVAKVEFKTDPNSSNVAFKNWNNTGKVLLIANVPSGIASTLALLAQYTPFPFFDKELYIEIEENPVETKDVSGSYYVTRYGGRIEIRNY
ncbi:hypothetical protein [Microseira sp. BLCC-F43]|jgi:hypothetical protein|uniref:hypothetical protein n=1 Tax=Microseira sp. BLCC-F43 TaxID=3153602 RepID=UPI0035B80DAC